MSRKVSELRFLSTAQSAIGDVILAGVRAVFHPRSGEEVSITTRDIREEMRNRRMRDLERYDAANTRVMANVAANKIIRGELYNRNLEILLAYEEELENGTTEKLIDPVTQFKDAFYERIARSEEALRQKFGR